MWGRTRGKLKEHFEGVHKNLDWAVHHVGTAATLIENQLAQLPTFDAVQGDPEKEQAFFMEHDLFKGVVALGESLQILDRLAKDIYDTF